MKILDVNILLNIGWFVITPQINSSVCVRYESICLPFQECVHTYILLHSFIHSSSAYGSWLCGWTAGYTLDEVLHEKQTSVHTLQAVYSDHIISACFQRWEEDTQSMKTFLPWWCDVTIVWHTVFRNVELWHLHALTDSGWGSRPAYVVHRWPSEDDAAPSDHTHAVHGHCVPPPWLVGGALY